MDYDSNQHHRRSVRREGHDYSGSGSYFLTICVARRGEIFGRIENGVVRLHPYGRIVEACWRAIPEHFLHIVLDDFIVMPDHVHGIIVFTNKPTVGARHASPLRGGRNGLGDVVGAFKSAATRGINVRRASDNLAPVKIWQRNYWKHIIRDERDLENHRRYIAENPTRWQTKRDYPA